MSRLIFSPLPPLDTSLWTFKGGFCICDKYSCKCQVLAHIYAHHANVADALSTVSNHQRFLSYDASHSALLAVAETRIHG